MKRILTSTALTLALLAAPAILASQTAMAKAKPQKATPHAQAIKKCNDDYAAALKGAGVYVTLSRYDGAIHGFWNFFSLLSLGRAAMNESTEWLRAKLS